MSAAGHDEWGERVDQPADGAPAPGDIVSSGGEELASEYGYRAGMVPEPVVGADADSPLGEDEPEGLIPPNPLWAMKERRHTQWHLLPAYDRHDRLREQVGAGAATVYAIDDGRHHVTLGHPVGRSPDGCGYCLVGRVPVDRFEALRAAEVAPGDSFDGAAELALCGVVVEDEVLSANVFDVTRYDDVSEVPPAFLPGAPFIEFPEDLEITVD